MLMRIRSRGWITVVFNRHRELKRFFLLSEGVGRDLVGVYISNLLVKRYLKYHSHLYPLSSSFCMFSYVASPRLTTSNPCSAYVSFSKKVNFFHFLEFLHNLYIIWFGFLIRTRFWFRFFIRTVWSIWFCAWI